MAEAAHPGLESLTKLERGGPGDHTALNAQGTSRNSSAEAELAGAVAQRDQL